MNSFQTFQAVQVTQEGAHLGRAGTVRTNDSVSTVDGAEVRTVGVMLDGDDETTEFAVSDLRVLG